jgi:membrane-bound ClpP family serine protease
LPGRLAICIEPIDGDLMAGVVELDQARWTAITIRGAQIARGATVEVVAVEGARLLVAEKPQVADKP